MDKEELYEMLDIEDPSEFAYFENIAALLECGEDIEFDHVAEIIGGADKDVLSGIIDDYFEEITDFVPGAETEVFTILENVRKSLVGLCRNIEDETTETKLIEEIERFRRFYSIESKVYCTDKQNFNEKEYTLMDALVLSRMERLGETAYEYDFSELGGYPIEEYVMSFGDMVTISERQDELDKAQAEIERNVLGML